MQTRRDNRGREWEDQEENTRILDLRFAWVFQRRTLKFWNPLSPFLPNCYNPLLTTLNGTRKAVSRKTTTPSASSTTLTPSPILFKLLLFPMTPTIPAAISKKTVYSPPSSIFSVFLYQKLIIFCWNDCKFCGVDLKSALGKRRRDGKSALPQPLTSIQRLYISRLVEKYGADFEVWFFIIAFLAHFGLVKCSLFSVFNVHFIEDFLMLWNDKVAIKIKIKLQMLHYLSVFLVLRRCLMFCWYYGREWWWI